MKNTLVLTSVGLMVSSTLAAPTSLPSTDAISAAEGNRVRDAAPTMPGEQAAHQARDALPTVQGEFDGPEEIVERSTPLDKRINSNFWCSVM